MSTILAAPSGHEIARNIQRQTNGRWVVWYGEATGSYWAIQRHRSSGWGGLVEAGTPVDLLARIGEVDAYYGARPLRGAAGAWRAA